ncbi:hypothetical protein DM01DRAFT_1330851 [Hesseltinella vesiculosa]|uniref:Beta-trefoil n=1 Tax=Hesseltinella vesiculosa TaxID=101127 RepID=A0A1X2GXA5_9FUNG|nr:hypothetical protein DM01DRAFT_1330851 [Hesseltinella vesiculosa]
MSSTSRNQAQHKESPQDDQHRDSHVISQHVYGSSKRIQLISLPSPMDSLLSAIDQHQHQQRASSTMSIESLLDSNGDTGNPHTTISMKRRLAHTDYSSPLPVLKHTRLAPRQDEPAVLPNPDTTPLHQQPSHLAASRMTTVTCYHAAVAQKSYGSEKRFLCPPPVVLLQTGEAASSPVHAMTMSVVGETGEKRLEQHAPVDELHQCTFKYLHVTGTAKAKHFSLRVDLSSSAYEGKDAHHPPYATFLSNPISIISKPSKKTAKARNVSSCILVNQPVSLFNRINSQTVRTKYMTSTDSHLCAKNSSWTPFDVLVLSQPPQYHTRTSQDDCADTTSSASQPLIYGSQIVLRNTRTGLRSAPYIIHKVDKGRIVAGAYGPVSQMQKVALQLASSRPGPPMYLSAMAASSPTNETNHDVNHATILDFAPSKMIPEGLDVYEKVDDFLCWTIVGVSTFEYSFYDSQRSSPSPSYPTVRPSLPASPPASSSSASPLSSPPLSSQRASLSPSSSPRLSNDSPGRPLPRCITPFPIITSVHYQHEKHTLDIVGQHLMQAVPSPKLLDLWLGSHHGPLKTTIQPQPQQPHQTHLLIHLPSTQDLLVANHDRLVTREGRRSLELPLYLVRQDGVVYHSGKVLYCEMLVNSDAGRWSVLDVKQ